MLNKVQLIGHLGADPECRKLNDGSPVVNFRIATSERWKDKGSGEMKERSEWHSIVVFAEHACKFAEQYLRKGARVFVEGKLQTRKWTDKQNVERYTTEIVVTQFGGSVLGLDRSEGNRAPAVQDQSEYGAAKGRSAEPLSKQIDDDIPF